MANAKLQIAIEAANNATGELKSLERDLKGVSSASNSSGVGFGKLVGAIGLGNIAANVASSAFNTLGDFLKGTITAAEEAEAGQAQLAAVLQSTGMAAGVTSQMANELAGKMADLTTYTDDEVLSAENLMLTFTNIGKNVFPGAVQAALDVSTAMGQDLKSSVVQLGKALNNPKDGMTALTRIGVTFSDAQQRVIDRMVETGDVAGAQKEIMQELTKEFGGSAAAAANTYQGKIKQLNNALGEIQENIGKAVLPALNLFVQDGLEAAKSAQHATEKSDTWSRSFYSLASGAKAAGLTLVALLKGIAVLAVGLVAGVGVVGAFAIDVVSNFKKIKDAGLSVFTALAKAATGDFSGAMDSLKTGFDFSGSFERTKAAAEFAKQAVGAAASSMAESFVAAGSALKEGVVQSGFKAIENAAPGVKGKITDAIGGGAASGAQKASEALQKVKDSATDVQSKIAETIRDYTQKSSDQLEAYQKKVAQINADMDKLRSDFAKDQAGKEKDYQNQQLDLFMAHQDKLAEAQKDFAALQKDLQKEADPERRDDLQTRVDETKKRLDAEQAIVNQYASLKDESDKFRATNDLERLRLKHEDEKLEDQRAFDDKMLELQKRMLEEETEYKKQSERLKEETTHRFDLMLAEFQKGYDKLIAESKAKLSQLQALESQLLAVRQSIEGAKTSVNAPSLNPSTHLAEGGIVTKPTVALIGERGPEAVIPLDKAGGIGGQSVNVSIMEGATINVTSEADESRLARTVAKELAKVLQGNRFGLAAQM
jgi:hypothetical protein